VKIKDLKIAYNVLSELDYPVPKDLLVDIAQKIRIQETNTMQRRIARMSEEQLIRLDNKQKRTIKIYLPDGRMIQKANSVLTFREAIKEIGAEKIAPLHLKAGHKEVILTDTTQKRRRIKHYYFLQPGYFLLDTTNPTDRYTILTQIDEFLRLNWEIEFI